MSQNPLQQFFRQPKIFVGLPSKGMFNKPGTLQGDTDNMPIYGMSGMDEILIRTPDALLAGESTVKVIESCCPTIKDGWEVISLDVELLLVAVRIATYGNTFDVDHKCSKCGHEAEYGLNLNQIIDHYTNLTYNNKIVLKDYVIKTQPLTYRQTTEFSLQNFKLQQQLVQAEANDNPDEKNKIVSDVFKSVGLLQNKVFAANVESVEIGGNVVVNERAYIEEWISNADKSVFDKIKEHVTKNRDVWDMPSQKVACVECQHIDSVFISMDQSSFFASA